MGPHRRATDVCVWERAQANPALYGGATALSIEYGAADEESANTTSLAAAFQVRGPTHPLGFLAHPPAPAAVPADVRVPGHYHRGDGHLHHLPHQFQEGCVRARAPWGSVACLYSLRVPLPPAVAYLEPCVAEVNKGGIKAAVLARAGAGGDEDANFTRLLGTITASGGAGEAKLGRAEAGLTTGPFMAAWKAKTRAVATVDPTRGIDHAFAIKNKTELVRVCFLAPCVCVCVCVCSFGVYACAFVSVRAFVCVPVCYVGQGNIQTAAKLTSRLYRKVMVPGVEKVMESDKKVKQSSISDKMTKALDNLEAYGIKVDSSLCLYAVEPVVQSGGKYDLNITKLKP